VEVHRDDVVPGLRVEVGRLAVAADARVVEDHVEAAKAVHRRPGQRLDLLDVADVGGQEHHPLARGVELLGEGASAGAVDVAEREPRPLAGEPARRGGADPRGRPGDRYDTFLEALRHALPSLETLEEWPGINPRAFV
jgi:hypothetical protein